MINTHISILTSTTALRSKIKSSGRFVDLRQALIAAVCLLVANFLLVAFHAGPPVPLFVSRHMPGTTPTVYQTPLLANSDSSVFQPAEISLLFVGDVMLGRQVNVMSTAFHDPNWPFLETADLLQSADLTVGNLEAPLVRDCPISGWGMQLCSPPANAAGLRWAGFDVIGLANNHALDYGDQGLADSFSSLDAYGLIPVRDDHVVVINVRGTRVGILAFEDTFMHPLDIDAALQAIAANAINVDFQVVMMHWGEEYQGQPTEQQISLGRLLIDSGVDVVIGAHPHWTQPVEEYGGGLIFYSLGNFVFDQMWSPETRRGDIALVTISYEQRKPSLYYRLIPIEIFDFGQPRFQTSAFVDQKHPD